MSKILLVDPPWYIFQGIKSNSAIVGIVYIATVLRENGHDCLVYNGDFTTDTLKGEEGLSINCKNYLDNMAYERSPAWGDFAEVLMKYNPDYVGISMHTPKYRSAVQIAKIVKNYNSDIPVLVGGLHPTIDPIETLKESFFDVAVVGEGEETIVELVKVMETGGELSSVKGICYKENGSLIENSPRLLIEDVDVIPFPDFTLCHRFEEYPSEYFNRILTSRGCPFNCIYCMSSKLWGRKVRFRSPEKVFEEIKYRYQKFGVRSFKFNDDTFTLNRVRLEKLCTMIINEKMKIKWECDTRADTLNEEVLTIMKSAGCFQLNIGVESGSEKVLNFIKKGESLEAIKKAFILAKKVKIKALAYFMMGFPIETKEDILRSIEIMKEIRPDGVCWSLFTPYPGSEIYKHLKQNGAFGIPSDWSNFFHHSPDMYFSSHISDEEWPRLIEFVDNAIKDYLRAREVEKFFENPVKSFAERISMYRKDPSLILKNFMLIPKIWRGALGKIK